MKKTSTIDQLNSWIRTCQDHKFISLRDSITNYKNLTFNYLVAFVSFPTNAVFRFECSILDMITNASYNNFKYSIFPRVNSFTKEVLEKYIERNLPIPIALFVADT
jgi:hypothetical protein